ncbi:MAG TPA: DNA-binding domain-containing protein [Pirellulales bacterium]|jgi:hypothetical protein|nr:DNA-binding domain-containing protein [Pirellulales bacterium]
MKQQSLQNVQRWMQSVITHPLGVEAGLAAPAQVEQIVEPSLRQSSVERLAIYANAYHARLIECLQAEFPVFNRTVGDEAFAEFAVAYLQRHPSHSYTLNQLGADFVQFLNDSRPAPAGGVKQTNSDWIDFLIDLAQLERTISEVFDGPGLEATLPISHADLLAIDAQRWPQARLSIAPCVRLLSLRFPLHDYYTAMKATENANHAVEIPQPQNSWLALTRRDYVVRRYELSRPQFVLLDALRCGQTVGDAVSAASAVYSGEIEQLAADMHEWFHAWTAAPMFERVAISG